MDEATTRSANGGRANNFAIEIIEIDADCANWASVGDLRRFGRRANLFGGQNDRYFGGEKTFPKMGKKKIPERKNGF